MRRPPTRNSTNELKGEQSVPNDKSQPVFVNLLMAYYHSYTKVLIHPNGPIA